MENNTVQENIDNIKKNFKEYPYDRKRHNSKDFPNTIKKSKPSVLNQPRKQN